jgi:hypothetical protein
MNTIKKLILENLNLRVFLPLLGLALATTWFGLFWSKQHFETLTGGTTFVDMQPGITPTLLFEQLGTYSVEAISFYIWWLLFDYAWPFITFTTMLFITAWLLNFVAAKWSDWFWLYIASAYLTVLMDWGENTGFLILTLYAGLHEPMMLAKITLGMHAAKLFFNMVFNAAFWILLIAARPVLAILIFALAALVYYSL